MLLKAYNLAAPVGQTPSTAQTVCVWVTVTAEHCPAPPGPPPPPPPVAVTKMVCVTCGVVTGAGTTTVLVTWPVEVDTVWLPPTVTVTTLWVGRTVSTVWDAEGDSGLMSVVAEASLLLLTATTTLLVRSPVDVEADSPPPATVTVTTLTVGITVCTVDEAYEAEPPPTASALVTATTEEIVVGTPLMVVWIVVGTEMTVSLVDVESDEPSPVPGTPALLGGSSVVTWTVEDDSDAVPLTVTVTTVGTLTTVLLDSEPDPTPPEVALADALGMKTDSLPPAGKRDKILAFIR